MSKVHRPKHRNKGGKKKKKNNFKNIKPVSHTQDNTNIKDIKQQTARQQNPKAFLKAQTPGKAKKALIHTAEKDQRRLHAPVLEAYADEPPPFVVLVQGPPQVGKSLLVRCLVKHYTKQSIQDIKGPITVIAGKRRRLTLVECPKDLNGMIDASKYADLVLLLIDANIGFEMETFEFLNLLQVNGFPKCMGVLTHLDQIKDKDTKATKATKKKLKDRFWAEIYQGAKLFYLSGLRNGKYMRREILNLARFIAVSKIRPLNWRQHHPYVIADRVEDVSNEEQKRSNPIADRDITFHGFVRGCNLRQNQLLHLSGVGDFPIQGIEILNDPCPLPNQLNKSQNTQKRKTLNDRERLLYAPMADLGDLLFDKDAVYIDIPNWKVQYTNQENGQARQLTQGENMVKNLQNISNEVDEKLNQSKIQFFSKGQANDNIGNNHQKKQREVYDIENDLNQLSDAEESLDDYQIIDEDNNDDDYYSEDEAINEKKQQIRQQQKQQKIEVQDQLQQQIEQQDYGDNKWKQNLIERANQIYSNNSQHLKAFVYQQKEYQDIAVQDLQHKQNQLQQQNDNEEFLLFKTQVNELQSMHNLNNVNALDTNVAINVDELDLDIYEKLQKGSDDYQKLKNRFVTGDWSKGIKRNQINNIENINDDKEILSNDDSGNESDYDQEIGSDGEVFGDFEDVENKKSDEAIKAAKQAIQVTKNEVKQDNEEIRKQRQYSKLQKKQAFDKEYDANFGNVQDDLNYNENSEDEVRNNTQGSNKQQNKRESSPTYYDSLKQELEIRRNKTKQVMSQLDQQQRIQLEGYQAGSYVRIKIKNVPYEFIQNFKPQNTILLGGVLASESRMGILLAKFKRHRWYPKLLKNQDPLIFSIGWRRFQSIPIYSVQDHNGRNRQLKYTPEHMHCQAAFYGPIVPPNTGVVAIQSMDSQLKSWRISATGTIQEINANINIVKKLRLVGTPYRIHKHTAFVQNMFNSRIEVARFEGAKLSTVSGIRGTIKKALRPGAGGAPDGSFRANFEDKPLMSDIIYLKAWVKVEIAKLFNPVTNLLASPNIQSNQAPSKNDPNIYNNKIVDPNKLGADLKNPLIGDHNDIVGINIEKELISSLEHQANNYQQQQQQQQQEGWVQMKTIAQIRREQNLPAPRDQDSLYKPIERAPKVFNPLRVPKNLQSQLPFKLKPKNEIALNPKRKTLEQKRAVILEPQEKKAYNLIQQLNAIRNQRALKRTEGINKHKANQQKQIDKEEQWKNNLSKEKRKWRYIQQGQRQQQNERKKSRFELQGNKLVTHRLSPAPSPLLIKLANRIQKIFVEKITQKSKMNNRSFQLEA